ncbi:MAG: ECF transporter S component [Defluviitaleaceae bacterium]|nr:ECF transporter S component [Defluviitaleaceae bacterium]MCL2273316.1 ECF transporter S component [Defluviitaleaceae bacterium]
MENTRTKQLTTLAMLAAMACLAMLINVPVIPAAPFLRYDPKDVIIVMGGFMFGPAAAFTLAAITALVEMVTISEAGVWGFLMNTLSSSAFAVSAAAVYKYKRTLFGAVIGLIAGVIVVIPVMLLWNYIVVPLFTGMPREVVAGMLVPVFLPFNAIKYGLNAAIALIIYKPIVTALTAAGLYRTSSQEGAGKVYLGVLVTAVFVVISLALIILILQGVI